MRLSAVCVLGVLLSGVTGGRVEAAEKTYDMTAVDEVEVKRLPERVAMWTRSEGGYFSSDNGLFSRLFRYIKDHDVAMTVPVEAEVEPATMRFYAGASDGERALQGDGEVIVERFAPVLVAALGVRGSYTEERYREALTRLEQWLADAPEYEPAGKPYAVYWNGPFVPGFLKRSEVHIPVRSKGD